MSGFSAISLLKLKMDLSLIGYSCKSKLSLPRASDLKIFSIKLGLIGATLMIRDCECLLGYPRAADHICAKELTILRKS